MSPLARAVLSAAAIALLLRVAYTVEKVGQWAVRRWAP